MTYQKTSDPRRGKDRKAITHSAILYHNGVPIHAVLSDVTERGARITLPLVRADMALGGHLKLELPGLGSIPLGLRWRNRAELGVTFELSEARLGTLKTQITQLVATHRR